MSSNRRIVWLIFGFICSVYFLTASGHIGGDGLWVYCAVESIVRDGNFDISDMKETIEIPELQNSYRDIHTIVEELKEKGNSRVYVQYGIGQILLDVPFYLLGHITSRIFPLFPHDYFTVFAVSLLNIFIVALAGVYVFLTLILLYNVPRIAFWLTLIFSFGTYVFVYAVKSGLSDPTIMLCLLGAVYHLMHFRNTLNRNDLLFSGGWCGLGFLVKFYFFITLPLLFIYLLYIIWIKERDFRNVFIKLIWYGIPLLISGIIFAVYNYIRFGNIFETGYSAYGPSTYKGLEGSIFDGSLFFSLSRAFGLLLSPGKGILFFAPPLFLFIPAFIIGWQKHRFEMLLIISLFVEVFVFFSASIIWHGEWSWGPRYLLLILPLVVIPVGALFVTISGLRFYIYISLLLIVGFLIQLPAVVMNNSNFLKFSNDQQIYGYRLFLPQYSPIIGNYTLLFSGLSRVITGESLTYPLYYSQSGGVRQYNLDGLYTYRNDVNLQQYDSFDLWITALWHQAGSNKILKFGAVMVYGFLLFLAGKFFKTLMRIIV